MDLMFIFKIKFSFPFSFFFFLSLFFEFDFLFVQDGETPLHYAAKHGYKEIAQILIEHGANVDFQDHVFLF